MTEHVPFQVAVKALEEEYSPLPDGAELINKITRKFSHHYENPAIDSINQALGTEFNINDIRDLMFGPSISLTKLV
jgi:hypothetical protein